MRHHPRRLGERFNATQGFSKREESKGRQEFVRDGVRDFRVGRIRACKTDGDHAAERDTLVVQRIGSGTVVPVRSFRLQRAVDQARLGVQRTDIPSQLGKISLCLLRQRSDSSFVVCIALETWVRDFADSLVLGKRSGDFEGVKTVLERSKG